MKALLEMRLCGQLHLFVYYLEEGFFITVAPVCRLGGSRHCSCSAQ